MDYEDKVLLHLQKMNPGERIYLNSLNNPARFRKSVIYLFDFGAISISDFEFNRDYTVLKRLRPINLQYRRKQIDRGIYERNH